jgi:hypothetical protein
MRDYEGTMRRLRGTMRDYEGVTGEPFHVLVPHQFRSNTRRDGQQTRADPPHEAARAVTCLDVPQHAPAARHARRARAHGRRGQKQLPMGP